MRTIPKFLAIAILLLSAVMTAAPADDGTITVKIREAIAFTPNTDNLADEQQDFYVCRSIDSNNPLWGPTKSNKDHATWDPPDNVSKLVSGKNQRYFDLYFELWDSDLCSTCGDEDPFDISPQNGPPPPLINNHLAQCAYAAIPTGNFPHVQYDVCTGQMEVKGVNGSPWMQLVGTNRASLDGRFTTSGNANSWGDLRFEVEREPANWLPDDLGIKDVQIVQSVYHASKAVADKETSLITWVASTYPLALDARVVGSLTDGFTTVNDDKLVHFEPGTTQNPSITMVSLFDGVNTPPFRPFKPVADQGAVRGRARVDIFETISPNAPEQLQDCANLNNEADAATLPLMKTNDLVTVYQPFDYEEDLNFMTSMQLQAMYDREEKLRIASWPLASLNSTKSFNQTWRDHGSNLCPFEPLCTMVIYDALASMAGIDRWVLSVRNGWFADNAFRHQFVSGGSIGWSLGAFAPRAVLAEDGAFGVAVHELGHTYNLSQHSCANPGLFGTDCFDEYNHQNPPDTNPYEAEGFDVRAGAFPGDAIYPNGIFLTSMQWPNFQCPHAATPGRDICAPNFMDFAPGSGYQTWIDTFTFHYMMETTLPHIDPPVVQVSGFVRLPDGGGDGSIAPLIEGAMPPFSYQFMGVQDFPEAPLSPMGEDFSGRGAFRVRLVNPFGVRDYRFSPRFFDNAPAPDLLSGFSLSVPWDPSTTAIQLIGPTDARLRECWNTLCPGDGVILDQRPVTPMPPTASDLRAGRDAPAPPTPPGSGPAVPTIGPGHDAVISWEASDADSPELRASLILTPAAAGGGSGPPMPVAVETSGNSFTIPHDRMAGAPGTYAGRLLVSDGVNTTELFQGPLLMICNLNNNGVEFCNGVDDDCDGIVDNGVTPGGISDVTLNPQPLPPGGGDPLAPIVEWMAEPVAQSYDVVFGDLGRLQAGGGDFGMAILGCLAENTAGTSVMAGPGPPQGQAFFYLVRGNNCIGPGTWDEVNSGPQQTDRDPGINASPAACQP